MLKDIIEISNGFQSSVNISYDLNNENKIRDFIPTISALELISNIISSTNPQSTQRAKILTGAYGRGKSHIVLVALSLLKGAKKKTFSKLLERMKEYDENIYKISDNYIQSKTKLLPVIISGNGLSLTQTFLNALQQALNSNNLSDIMPDTNFEAAKNTIKMWKEKYPETYKLFTKSISETPNAFNKKLDKHDPKSYQEFLHIYPELTAGSVFNPFINSNAEEIYEQVSKAIAEKGYNGLYIVYDEFGKYLETNMSDATESDTLFLQNLAEKCKRSGNHQMHLMLICHKDISNYIDMNLPQEKVDGWRGISGRFEHINLHNNYSQMYEIISAVIKKNPDTWDDFCTRYDDIFKNMAKIFTDNQLISNDVKHTKKTVISCYPLHPSTTFILPRLSEKVAQNERTSFTFLSANQKNTLLEYIDNNEDEIPFVTPDVLYDYFELQFRKELNSTEIFKTYQLAANILKKVAKGSLQSKIIKTIALIYIIEQFEKFPPTVDNVVNTFIDSVSDPKEITDAINDLLENSCIIYLKRSNNYLKLKGSSGVNIKEQIQDRIELLKSTADTKGILNALATNQYLYPVKYNDRNCITRYFECKFITVEELTSDCRLSNNGASGLLRYLFFETKSEFEVFNKNRSSELKSESPQIVTVVPNRFVEISSLAFEYRAVQELKLESTDDEVLSSEYDVYLEDLDVVVNNFINSFSRPEMGAVDYYYQNNKLNLKRKAQLSELLSGICNLIYPDLPVINNESINKNYLPTVAVNSRSKITTALLESNTIEENLGLTGTGQDVSIMRSTLIQTGILAQNNNRYELDLSPNDKKIANVLKKINDFFVQTSLNGEASFEDLYTILTSSDGKIGLKYGVIPIFIAVVLNCIKNDVVIRYKGEETRITSDLLNSINEHPKDYSVIMENWSKDKGDYLKKLETTFNNYIVEKERSYNSFAYLALAMSRWYMELPRCCKDMTSYYDTGSAVPKEYIKFIGLLKAPNDNSRELLMEQIPKAFKQKDISIVIADSIESAKKEFESAKYRLTSKVIAITTEVFNGKKKASLTSILKDWFEGLKTSTIQNQFVGNENSIISLISTVTNDEATFIERLAKAIVGLRMDDWNSDSVAIFETRLKDFKKTVDDFNISGNRHTKGRNGSYKFVFYDSDGNEITRFIDKAQFSGRAKLLYNDITSAVEEMGESITDQEKRQVLIEILQKLCE